MNEFNRQLWMKAQEIARQKYNEEWGTGAWEMQTDKYEREDWASTEYEKLLEKEENNMEMIRDSKGRFVGKANGNNETTNTNLNKKENDNMMNKTNAEKRMETLRNNGVNVDNFFNLNLQIPFGSEVKIMVDGKEMVIPATNGRQLSESEMMVKKMINSHNSYVANNDAIAQSIINDGYVKNSSLFRRWIFAHTMKLINYVDRKNPNRKGWEAGFKDMYSYGYCFEMMTDELHTLAKLQKEDPEYFAERTCFFNGNVAVALLEDYLYRLKKYCKKQMRENPKKYRGEQYCKLARYGNVLVKDLDAKVYTPIQNGIVDVEDAVRSGNYKNIEKTFNNFVAKLYNKLPYETPKCAAWKDAYKGAGGFYSLQNAIRFHNVVLDGCSNKYDSERELYRILYNTPSCDVWVFHNLLVSTLELNNFNLKQSIANGHAAPNTISKRAERY